MWEFPVPGESYYAGADVGGEQKGADSCAAYVIHGGTNKVVASLHGHMEYDVYAKTLCLLGQFYNWALLAVENNHQPAVAKDCFREEYPNLYHYLDEASIRRNMAPKPGFNTNRKTKPEIVAHLDNYTRNKRLICKDKKFAEEMENFVWVERDKTYKATGTRHDDRIMAMGIALYILPQSRGKKSAAIQEEEMSWAYRRFLEVEGHSEDSPEGVLLL